MKRKKANARDFIMSKSLKCDFVSPNCLKFTAKDSKWRDLLIVKIF